MTAELEVRLFDGPVGWLTAHQGRLAFRYDNAWLANPLAGPLSASLPLRPEPFDDVEARAYFSGLLPEGRVRQLLARQFQVSNQNDFALLEQIGGECAGAVSFVVRGTETAAAGSTRDILWFRDGGLAAALDELSRRPLLAGTEGVRLSLAGAQEKLAVVVENGRIGLPRGNTPSTHLLKPAIPGVEDSVANEAFCMRLAAAMGIPTAAVAMGEVQGRAYLLVARCDRVRDASGHPARLHQEDFCQALGVVPEMKYQNEGGPGLAACFDLIRRVTRPSATSLLRLLDVVIFNALVGNHDAHGKNFSLLHRQAVPELAPLYDCLCTAAHADLSQQMAMKIGSKYAFDEVWPCHWQQLAKDAGLSPAQTRKRVAVIARELPEAARSLASEAGKGFIGRPIVGRIVAIIEARCAMTLRRMDGAPSPASGGDA